MKHISNTDFSLTDEDSCPRCQEYARSILQYPWMQAYILNQRAQVAASVILPKKGTW